MSALKHVNSEKLSVALQKCLECVHTAKAEFDDGIESPEDSPDFNISLYWEHYGSLVKSLSHEGTKLAVFVPKMSASPSEEEEAAMVELVRAVEMQFSTLVAHHRRLPKGRGLLLWKAWHLFMNEVIESMMNFIKAMASDTAGAVPQMTGIVLGVCNKFPSLPKDNAEALARVAADNYTMICDAVSELEENFQSMETEDSESESIIQEKQILSASLGLVKISRGLCKKLKDRIKSRGNTTCRTNIEQLDMTGQAIQRLSPAVDDFVMPVQDLSEAGPDLVKEEMTSLQEMMKLLIEEYRACHMHEDADEPWESRCHEAIDHNVQKVITTLQ